MMQSSVFALGELSAVLINVLGAALIVLELSGRTIAFSHPYIRPNRFHWSAVSVATAGAGAACLFSDPPTLGNIFGIFLASCWSILPRGLKPCSACCSACPGLPQA